VRQVRVVKEKSEPISAGDVAGIARHYRDDGSFDAEMMERAAAADVRREFTLAELRSELQADPRLVEDWLSWSAGKTSFPAWLFSDNGDETFAVCRLDQDGELLREALFRDKFLACSAFIIHEVEDHR